jgi:hypothetical protein
MITGIDYGSGLTNIDHATGIRYGVISQHSVGEVWYDESTPDYGDPTCPKCGGKVLSVEDDAVPEDREHWGHKGSDFACLSCETTFFGDAVYSDEPTGHSYDNDGYKLTDCLDSDIMVIASPFYTLAPFCSPCVPGAGNLDSACEDGVKTFCLGHDWFESGKAPYAVYSVETGAVVTE